jgi:hypothetical protein
VRDGGLAPGCTGRWSPRIPSRRNCSDGHVYCQKVAKRSETLARREGTRLFARGWLFDALLGTLSAGSCDESPPDSEPMPGCATTRTVVGDTALLLELADDDPNRVVAHTRHGSTYFGDGERHWSVEQYIVARSVLPGPARCAGGNPLLEAAIRARSPVQPSTQLRVVSPDRHLYALSAPIGTFASGDQERWNDPATNALLARYANAQTDAERQAVLCALEGLSGDQDPHRALCRGRGLVRIFHGQGDRVAVRYEPLHHRHPRRNLLRVRRAAPQAGAGLIAIAGTAAQPGY